MDTKLGQQFPMFGLSNAGKTTLLYRLVLSEFVQTIGDHNLRMETFTVPNLFRRDDNDKGRGVQQKELRFTLWDVAGQTDLIPLWYRCVDSIKAKGVIFVIDSTCRESLEYAKGALWRLFNYYGTLAAKDEEEGKEVEKEGLVLLVFANKQDQFNAMTVAEVMRGLDLEGLCGGEPQGPEGRRRLESRWHIRGTVASTGEGLVEGLLWLDWQVNGPPRSSC
ncbi:MAG: ADP-ribosylation factor family-domain-containing protein [Linnemannia gamsii]|nr:MAG: ADP-ribosylation factor family-domain-containing protein [Linnemannia gamsii]